MKVVLSVLGAAFVAGLIACSGASPAATSDAASTGVSGTAPASSDGTSAATAPAATASTTDAGVSDTDAAATTAPATPQTCDTLAASAATPAGALQITSVHGIQPVDVYATQDDNGLTITLTTTANECGYRTNNLSHESIQELQFTTATPQGGFVPGSFKPSQMKSQQGTQCFPQQQGDDDDGFFFPGNAGTSFQEGSVRGTLTITAIDASSVTGTMDVTDFNGRHDTFTFTAPICAAVTQDQVQGATCCADPNQQ